jgi:hypothetical protein
MAFISEMEEPHRPAGARVRSTWVRSPWFWVQSAGLAASLLLLAYFYLVRDPELVHELNRLELALQSKPAVTAGETSDAERRASVEEIASSDALGLGEKTDLEAASDGSAPDVEPRPDEDGSPDGDAPPLDAETLVSSLMLALERGDVAAIKRWTAELRRLHDQSVLVFQRLIESYDTEDRPDKKAKILEILNHFPTEASQAFYLDRLAVETQIDLRRGLVRGIYETVETAGQPLMFGVVDQLTMILNNPEEDWEVRAFAGKTLIREMVDLEKYHLLDEVRRVVLDSKDARLRGELLDALARTEPAAGFAPAVIDVLVEALNVEADHNATVKAISGLQHRSDTEDAMRVIEEISRRVGEKNHLKLRLRRAQERLASELFGDSDLERK